MDTPELRLLNGSTFMVSDWAGDIDSGLAAEGLFFRDVLGSPIDQPEPVARAVWSAAEHRRQVWVSRRHERLAGGVAGTGVSGGLLGRYR